MNNILLLLVFLLPFTLDEASYTPAQARVIQIVINSGALVLLFVLHYPTAFSSSLNDKLYCSFLVKHRNLKKN